jgi:hypothetical protein
VYSGVKLCCTSKLDIVAPGVPGFKCREPSRNLGSLRRANTEMSGECRKCTRPLRLTTICIASMLFVFSLVPAQFASAHVGVRTAVKSALAVSVGAHVMQLLIRQHVML